MEPLDSARQRTIIATDGMIQALEQGIKQKPLAPVVFLMAVLSIYGANGPDRPSSMNHLHFSLTHSSLERECHFQDRGNLPLRPGRALLCEARPRRTSTSPSLGRPPAKCRSIRSAHR